MKTRIAGVLSVFSVLSLATVTVQNVAAADAEPVSCVTLTRIDHTHAVDDQTLLFYMRNGDIYVNRMSNPASGLSRNRPFMYKTSTGQLCNHDIITVLEPLGFGYMQGAWSALGKFVPTDEAHADALVSGQPVDSGIESLTEE